MSRRYAASDVSVDRYDDRRVEYRNNGRGREYDDRFYDDEIDYRRGPVRERDVRVREEVRVRERSSSRDRERDRGGPEFLREDYGRTSAGPVVLRKREIEDFEFVPKPRRRSPSPEPVREREREEIIIRRDESERPPPRREREVDREEIIIRRDEVERPPRRERDREVEREEIIIRTDERERDRRGPPRETERDEIIIRRDEGGGKGRYDDDVVSRRGGRGDRDREEIIIRRDERDDDTRSRYGGRGYDDYALATRPKSHERERSRVGRASSPSSHEDEVIIRRDTREGRDGREREREEIIIRKHSPSRSNSLESSLPEPPVIRAPPIHQEVITHHRHIDHGYEIARPREIISRPPSPPMPPPRARSEERIEIKRSGERNGRHYDEDIIIKRNDDDARSVGPARSVRGDDDFAVASPRRGGYRDRGYDRDDREEADYYNAKALERSYPGEGYNGATEGWAIVDVPPGTRKVAMDGAGGGRQEITWQKYNGVRRSKFMPEGSDEGYGSEVGRPARPEAGGGEIGRRYGPRRNPTDGLWTEITKDLVVKEAITEAGYEFEETEDFYYVIAYLGYVSSIALSLSIRASADNARTTSHALSACRRIFAKRVAAA